MTFYLLCCLVFGRARTEWTMVAVGSYLVAAWRKLVKR